MSTWCYDGFSKLVRSPPKELERERLGSNGGEEQSSARAPTRTLSLDGDAKRLNELLPEHTGCGDQLRKFWAIFSQIELSPLLDMENPPPDAISELNKAKRRCMEAAYPFNLVIELLENRWKPSLEAHPGCSVKRQADRADRVLEHYETVLIVQRLLGRSFPAPNFF